MVSRLTGRLNFSFPALWEGPGEGGRQRLTTNDMNSLRVD